ncbi:MAG: hypothetical protein IKG21_13215 [Atopobiaceae bacterium]|nr:hypothetical protein [Atopobiaceae bacterium]
MRELRHDFRTCYHVAYDDVPVAEAIDLIRSLPDGSLYVAATEPERAWSELKQRTADVVDAIWLLVWANSMDHEKMPEPQRVTRPKDVAARQRQRERQRRAREVLENTEWVEV